MNQVEGLNLVDLIPLIGITKALFVVFFVVMHGWVFLLYRGRLKDRQKEIDRIAEENRQYREIFVGMLDKRFGERDGESLENEREE